MAELLPTEQRGTIECHCVGDLRRAIEGLPDTTAIVSQVVAKNGQAWNMYLEFTAHPTYLKWASLVQLKHEELERLPPESFAGGAIET